MKQFCMKIYFILYRNPLLFQVRKMSKFYLTYLCSSSSLQCLESILMKLSQERNSFSRKKRTRLYCRQRRGNPLLRRVMKMAGNKSSSVYSTTFFTNDICCRLFFFSKLSCSSSKETKKKKQLKVQLQVFNTGKL